MNTDGLIDANFGLPGGYVASGRNVAAVTRAAGIAGWREVK
jgi:hypothetical protein